MSRSEYPEYVAPNVDVWTRNNENYTGARARESWAREEIDWGIFGVPETEVGVLGDVAGLDVLDLGCGTGYLSAQLARLGARPVGIDPTPAQLETARQLQAETGIEFPLIEAIGEDVPLPDASFDLAVSEYGASIWADPHRWIPEAARLLRPGGRLVFLRNSTVSMLCMALDGITERLQRGHGDVSRIDWPDTGEVEFHPPAGELIDILRAAGFEIERLVELYAPETAETHGFYNYVTAEWARKWPHEEIWVARKR